MTLYTLTGLKERKDRRLMGFILVECHPHVRNYHLWNLTTVSTEVEYRVINNKSSKST